MFVQSHLAVSLDHYNIRPALTIPKDYALVGQTHPKKFQL